MQERGVPPIIILGMHRSGTSVVAAILEQAGLFLGAHQDANREAVFFQRLNNWLLRQAGAAWDNPEAFHCLATNRRLREFVVDYMRYLLRSPRVRSYEGWRSWIKGLFGLDMPWGWKDPRNTYTLPLWLDCFPDAKVIHVCRHGVDVAHSLMVRQERSIANGAKDRDGSIWASHPVHRHQARGVVGFARSVLVMSARYVDAPLYWRFFDSVRCASLEGGFTLWESYLEEANRHMPALGDRGLVLRYEDLLWDPSTHLHSLVRFCGLTVMGSRLEQIGNTLDASRAYAYRNRSELREFSNKVALRLARFGYSA